MGAVKKERKAGSSVKRTSWGTGKTLGALLIYARHLASKPVQGSGKDDEKREKKKRSGRRREI